MAETLILLLIAACVMLTAWAAVLSARLGRYRRLVVAIGASLYANATVRGVVNTGRDWCRKGRNVYGRDDLSPLVCEAASQSDAERVVSAVNALKSVHSCIEGSGCLRAITAD